MKELMLGNQAVARGLYEAGCRIVSSYPGTPSTEITEYAAEYDEIYAEWAPNEKVAAEVAVGASLQGARSFCAMKHVGLNVAADPVYTASYTGVNGGMVLAVADDPGMHSSQNEQDSRHHAIAAKVPMLEPSDSQECKDFARLAFELSEKYDTLFMLRLCTRVAHARSLVELCDREEHELKNYEKNPAKNIMMPAMAIKRHVFVEQRMKELTDYAETASINRCEINDNTDIGVITAGISYQYAKEALGKTVSYLKLGMVNPLPTKLIKDFAAKFSKVYVIEELDGIIENHCRAIGINVVGKELFGEQGEFSQSIIADKMGLERKESVSYPESIPGRPPVMCPGCPHRGVYYVLKQLGCTVSGDIGCYTLGALAPLSAMDASLCMGGSVTMLHGMSLARGKELTERAVAVIGDSTFIHSGITGIINSSYNRQNTTTVVLDNSITGMTGHQQNPATGITLKGEVSTAVNIEALARAVGYKDITVVDPYDLAAVKKAISEALKKDEPSLVISRRPCALLKTVKRLPALKCDHDKCRGCKACMKIGCPAISIKDKKAVIDHTQCVGCGVCKQLCAFDAIG